MKVMVCSLNGDTNFFDIVTGVLQWDTLALYLFIFCLDYVLWMSIDLIKEKDWKYFTVIGYTEASIHLAHQSQWLSFFHLPYAMSFLKTLNSNTEYLPVFFNIWATDPSCNEGKNSPL